MRTFYSISTALVVLFLVASCGNATVEKKGPAADKKAELAKLKAEQEELSKKIAKLEEEISAVDSTARVREKLVTVETLQPQSFKHYIDLQGRVITDNEYWVTPRGMGGQVRAIYVKEGQAVKKGQLLMKLDAGTLEQQLEQAKIQLDYLKDIYQRRKNLWDQKIGTEVELIAAKNAVDNQQKQIDLLNEQISYTNVTAEVSGVVDQVNIRVGEAFSSATATVAGIKIVNPSDLKVRVGVPENYLPHINRGTPVVVEVPDVGKTFNSTISYISQTINPTSRVFEAEAKIPVAPNIKPNLVAIVKLLDYQANNTIVVPMRTVQTDQNGKYVYVLGQERGRNVAVKKQVEVGQVYGEQIEIKSGLAAGDQLITQGYQGLYEGQIVTTAAK
jgi:membrane fusion protein (multidrug efflux system)